MSFSHNSIMQDRVMLQFIKCLKFNLSFCCKKKKIIKYKKSNYFTYIFATNKI